MKEENLQVFIDGTLNYFSQTTGIAAEMGVPYLKGPEPVLLDFTGLIGISGSNKGCVYLTASRRLLEEVARAVLESEELDIEIVKDMAAEIANTIAGNARRVLGSSFMISVPIVITGIPQDISLPIKVPTFVIPFSWQSLRAFLVVGIAESG